MAVATGTAILAGAAIMGGAAVASMATAPKAPDIPPAPPPSSYYSYDESGNPAGEQVWDASKNAYVYKPAPLTEEQKAQRAKREQMKAQLLSNLGKTPEDRVRAYDEYAKTFSEAMHKDVDKQYAETKQAEEENMNARGLFGSKAYVDSMAKLREEKATTDTDIARQAVLAKENLASTDRQFWLNELNALESQGNTEYAQALEGQRTAQQGANMGTAAVLGSYNASVNPTIDLWKTRMAQNASDTQTLGNTAAGLAFLYGFRNSAKNAGTGGTDPFAARSLDSPSSPVSPYSATRYSLIS